MTIYLTFLLALILSCQTLFAQTYNQVVDNEIIIQLIIQDINLSPKNRGDSSGGSKIINAERIPWTIAKTRLSGERELDSFESHFNEFVQPHRYIRSEPIDEMFDQGDIAYMSEQIENETSRDWDFQLDQALLRKRLGINYYSYSIPLFDKEFESAIIYKEFHCGSLCAEGTAEVYRKINGKWVHYTTLHLWIS